MLQSRKRASELCGSEALFVPALLVLKLEGDAPITLDGSSCLLYTSTVVTGRPSGHPVRSLKTPMARKCLELEKINTDKSLEELEAATAGSLRKAVQDGNYEEGTFMSGQIAGMLKELRPCADIIRSMTDEAEQLLKNAYKRFE